MEFPHAVGNPLFPRLSGGLDDNSLRMVKPALPVAMPALIFLVYGGNYFARLLETRL